MGSHSEGRREQTYRVMRLLRIFPQREGEYNSIGIASFVPAMLSTDSSIPHLQPLIFPSKIALNVVSSSGLSRNSPEAPRPASPCHLQAASPMGTDQRWTSEEWRKLQTSLFAVTGNTRIKLSSLTPPQWELIVKGTGRSKADIDAALTAMLKRQEIPGG